jgi:hypothetical protein
MGTLVFYIGMVQTENREDARLIGDKLYDRELAALDDGTHPKRRDGERMQSPFDAEDLEDHAAATGDDERCRVPPIGLNHGRSVGAFVLPLPSDHLKLYGGRLQGRFGGYRQAAHSYC